ncbi:MAG: Co2+/Mg2+ efflux protein ApaG [Gammaproteobacteria bacterium]
MNNQNYNIHIEVTTRYIEEQSAPEHDHYVFSYHITLRNNGDIAAQLLSRHWIITDANNKTQEVKGEGVVGEQPLLQPGEEYSYSSGTLLETPVGSMRGNYQMIAADNHHFDAEIPEFMLSIPRTLH